MRMRIGARGKIGYLTGAKVEPPINFSGYEGWATDNERVKSWLIDSMEISLMNRYIRLPTAKDIWEAAEKTFYDDSDETQIFELNKKCFEAKKNHRPIPTYYNELVAMFQEIDQVRGEILRKAPKFSLEQSYAYIRKVQSEKQTMGSFVPTEASVLAVQNRIVIPPSFSSFTSRRPTAKPNPYANKNCNACGELGHNMERCCEEFDRMSVNDVVTWSVMLAGYAQNGRSDEALALFEEMKNKQIKPNDVTLVSVLSACAKLGSVDTGERIGSHVENQGYVSNVYVTSALLDMYSKCGNIRKAQKLFDKMPHKDIDVTWNSLLIGWPCIQHGLRMIYVLNQSFDDAQTKSDDAVDVKCLYEARFNCSISLSLSE